MKRWKVLAASILSVTMIGASGAFCSAATISSDQVFDAKEVQVLKNELHNKTVCVDAKAKTVTAKSRQKSIVGISTYSDTSSSGSAKTISGTYPTRKGMIVVTGDYYKNLIPTGHAAIVYSSTKVVESLSNGVVVGKNDWYSTKKTCYGGSVRSTTTTQDANVANWCYNRIGKPYNYNYFNTSTRSKFYCSQLVWAGFLDLYGIDLNTSDFKVPGLGNPVHPLELLDNNYTYVTYSQE